MLSKILQKKLNLPPVISRSKISLSNCLKVLRTAYSMCQHGINSSYPIRFQIEASSVCNLKCEMCTLSVRSSSKNDKRILAFETFKVLFDKIKPLVVDLTGQGEPLLNKELLKIVKYAKLNGAGCGFNTNTILLNESLCEDLLNAGLDYIGCSFHSTNKKTYEKIMVGANFETALNNIKMITTKKKELKSDIILDIGAVISEYNYMEVPEMIHFFYYDLGIEPSFSPPLSYGLDDLENKISKLSISKDIITSLKKGLELAEQLSLIKTISCLKNTINYFENKELAKQKQCYFPYINVMVYCTGEVRPCCYMPYSKKDLGNIYKSDFEDIWNGKGFQNFRKQLIANRASIKECSVCPINQENYSKICNRINYFIPGVKNG